MIFSPVANFGNHPLFTTTSGRSNLKSFAKSCKKVTIFGEPRKFFGPSYFVTALVFS
jgi:hypothetical protein